VKTAVVTGGGSGIGHAVAARLRADGLNVATIDLKPGDEKFGYAADVTDRAAVDAALEEIRTALGPVTVLVNAAGLERFKRFTDIAFDDWKRVIDVNRARHIVWQYGTTGVVGNGFDQLSNPNSAELLANGHILIADENNNRVIEVTRSHHIVWQYGHKKNTSTLNGAAFASRLPNGDTLITDSNNNRILIVTHGKKVVFDYATNTRKGSMAMPLPTRAVMLRNGNILISDQFNDQVIEINSRKHIVFAQGKIQVDGSSFGLLNAPYDAKAIGDYTGQTPPPRVF